MSEGELALAGDIFSCQEMSKYVSWRASGPVKSLYFPKDLNDLQQFIKHLPMSEPLIFMGLGSNTLIKDEGFDGTVVVTQGKIKSLTCIDEVRLRAEGGVSCSQLSRFAARNNISGLEFLAGIPGTIGGALTMNAGCYGGETWDFVEAVEVVNRQGDIYQRPASDYQASYRHVSVYPNEYFVAGIFKGNVGQGQESLSEIKAMLAKRNSQQPTHWPNGGSVFRNPPGMYAAQLIESCGLKGYRIGGATVSPKHANFIINEDQATATDILKLIDYVARTVLEQKKVQLIREVRVIGKGGYDE